MLKRKLPSNIAAAFLVLFLTNVIWAIAGPVIKITLEFVPLNSFLFFRFLVTCLLVLPFILMELRKNPVDKRDYFNFFMLGLFSQGSLILIFAAFEYTTVLDATIIGVLGTLLSVAAGHYFYKEKVDKNVIIGLSVVIMGTLMIVLEPLLSTTVSGGITASIKTRMWGNFLAVLYSLSFLIYIVWSKMSMGEKSGLLKKTMSFIHLKPMRKKYSPFVLMGTSFYVGLIVFTPLSLMENLGWFGPHVVTPSSFTLTPILGVLYMAILSSIVAYLGFQWALEYVTVRDSALMGYLQPILVLPFAYIMLSEVPTPATLINSVVIALGVIVAEIRKS